jgi:hypothetical protein
MMTEPKGFPMKFSIRDVLLVTVIVALAIGWQLDRSRLARGAREVAAKAAREVESQRALSKALAKQLQDKNPAARVEIKVRGGASTTTVYRSPNSSGRDPDPNGDWRQ